MIIRHGFRIWSTILLLSISLFFLNTVLADEPEKTNLWECINLLDEQTKSSLASQEQFFASLFQLPTEFEQASDAEKTRLINDWIRKLQGKNYGNVTKAAAYLGIAKAKQGVKNLEKILAAGRGGGRLRWVCARSLGQIRNKGSIPVLIDLLDNKNKDTRVYARVALAEITGVYFGDDKERWKNLKRVGSSKLCTSSECKTKEAEHKTFSLRKSVSRDMLDFCLPDIYGRIVDSQDYVNVPVLIMSGSCWCGGCQQDAEPLRKIAAEYADRGLAVIRTVAGDNELAALDFQKHYRLPFVQLLDTNRSFEKRYNPDGWTFLMLSDPEGKIVYKINSPHKKNWLELRRILDKMLSPPISNKTIIRDGIAYMPATLQRSKEVEKQHICERFPSIACGPNGQIYVVFTTNRNGSNDVFLRVFNGSGWSEDIPIAVTADDEYDGTVLVDKQGRIWVCWTSNSDGAKYNIYVISFKDHSKPGTPVRITYSDDDAMHPRMVCDQKDRIWVTYYKWHKLWNYSRDKEVYIRKYEDGKWSDEMQVSPTDVPDYEDHSESSISAYQNGVVVVWSWDFHPPNKGYSNQAEHPTIFVRYIDDTGKLGKLSSVSFSNIDVTPSVAVSGNRKIWCCWDSLGGNRRKNVCVSNAFPGLENRPRRINIINDSVANVCTPTFANHADSLALLWSETEDNANWVLKLVNLDAKSGKWGGVRTIESQSNPRYCSGAYDNQGRLWLAYSIQTEKGRKIVVKNTADLKFNSPKTILHSDSERLRELIDQKYSYRDLRDIDWDRLFKIYTPRLERAKTPHDFAELAAEMLRHAKDMHLWVKVNGETVNGFRRKIGRNYNLDLLRREVPGWKDLSRYVSTGRFPGDIGYILIKSWRKDKNQVLNPALKAIRGLSNSRALIIDVRPNGGGSETYAASVAGCFIDRPVVYAKHVYRDNDTQTGGGKIHERTLRPNPDLPTYQGQVAVLMGQANLSSCEAFILMMKQIPNCKLIGERSYGSSGNPKPYDLGNRVTIWLPSWKALRPDGSCFEGQGIKPDIRVRTNKRLLRGTDPVLESALRYLKDNL